MNELSALRNDIAKAMFEQYHGFSWPGDPSAYSLSSWYARADAVMAVITPTLEALRLLDGAASELVSTSEAWKDHGDQCREGACLRCKAFEEFLTHSYAALQAAVDSDLVRAVRVSVDTESQENAK